jgi:hypothetical protein
LIHSLKSAFSVGRYWYEDFKEWINND